VQQQQLQWLAAAAAAAVSGWPASMSCMLPRRTAKLLWSNWTPASAAAAAVSRSISSNSQRLACLHELHAAQAHCQVVLVKLDACKKTCKDRHWMNRQNAACCLAAQQAKGRCDVL
jgi:hypothetical protein